VSAATTKTDDEAQGAATDAANDASPSAATKPQSEPPAAVSVAVGRCGWAFVGSSEHPAVVLDVRATRLFIVTGTSSDYLTDALQGKPLIVYPARGRQLGWPGTTHFYPKSTTTVSALRRETGNVGPLLLMQLRKLVGY